MAFALRLDLTILDDWKVRSDTLSARGIFSGPS
jgi:hypothetical protein